MQSLPNLTTITRESLLINSGEMIVEYGPGTGRRARAEFWHPGATESVTSLQTQRGIETWLGHLRQAGLSVLQLRANIPMTWEKDMVDELPLGDIRDLSDYLGELIFDLPGMRKLQVAQMILAPGDDGIDLVYPDVAVATATESDPSPLFEVANACHSWLTDNHEWLMQHTQSLEMLLRVQNPRLRRSFDLRH
ncbi:hypothetical protein MCP1_390004 [Candidatus Terasakiella magnetica]|nr:hypothetical protein MCP1_390004 [Candidatus Terasakiella magnetica]